ncbi:MAG: type I 3-dehydroquinate dehydratase [Syntrophobacteria bacterium]
MGPLGRVSRIACPLVGGAFTFAALEGGAEAAPGQLTVAEMRHLLHVLT